MGHLDVVTAIYVALHISARTDGMMEELAKQSGKEAAVQLAGVHQTFRACLEEALRK